MKILYVSCHSRLQETETQVLRNLGHEVTVVEPSDSSNDANVSGYDVILVCHRIDWMNANRKQVNSLKQKIVYRSVGQSTPYLEDQLRQMREANQIKIVRMSPTESHSKSFHYMCPETNKLYSNAGTDAFVRCPTEHKPAWRGGNNRVCAFSNHVHDRLEHVKYKYIEYILGRNDGLLYGWGNEDKNLSVETQGLSLEDVSNAMEEADVVFFTGTWPSPYTLSLMELLNVGTPIISIGPGLFYKDMTYWGDTFEVPNILSAYKCGFWSDDLDELDKAVKDLLEDKKVRQEMSNNARKAGKELFGETSVEEQWKVALDIIMSEVSVPNYSVNNFTIGTRTGQNVSSDFSIQAKGVELEWDDQFMETPSILRNNQ